MLGRGRVALDGVEGKEEKEETDGERERLGGNERGRKRIHGSNNGRKDGRKELSQKT